jgi:hypothetical protein
LKSLYHSQGTTSEAAQKEERLPCAQGNVSFFDNPWVFSEIVGSSAAKREQGVARADHFLAHRRKATG